MAKLATWLSKYEDWKANQDQQLGKLGDRVLNEGYGSTAYGPYITSATGCRISDVNDNSFLDTAMAGGTALLGHAHQGTNQAIANQLEKGSIFTAPNATTHAVADSILSILPWFNRIVMCSSGSEATMRAIRIARAHTGRKKIAVFSGGWHGAHDQVLFEEDYQGAEDEPRAVVKGKGILPGALKHVMLLPYNHSAAFDLIEQSADDLAMVFIEPAQGSNPRDDISAFLKELRRVTRKHSILLGFDEIITGFRLALGGGQEYFGVHADIATYGKTIGGGLPIGMVAGTDEVMSVVRTGPVFMGGTFSANPLSMASAQAVVEYLRTNSTEIYLALSKKGMALKSAVNDFCTVNTIPVHMIGAGSMLRLIFSAEPVTSRRHRDLKELDYSRQGDFYAALLMNGVHVAGNRIIFLSSAHDSADMEKLVQAITETLLGCHEAGLFDRVIP